VAVSCAGQKFQVAVSCAHDTATNTEWQLPEVVLTQFFSPYDEHDVLETCRELKNKNKYIEKNCESRWSFTKNHNMMHGQQNVKFRTKCTFTKLIFKFLIFWCVLYISIPRVRLQEDGFVRIHSSTYKTAYTEGCKAHCTIPVYTTVFLKMNARVRNM
jgi:hypothetical protein